MKWNFELSLPKVKLSLKSLTSVLKVIFKSYFILCLFNFKLAGKRGACFLLIFSKIERLNYKNLIRQYHIMTMIGKKKSILQYEHIIGSSAL